MPGSDPMLGSDCQIRAAGFGNPAEAGEKDGVANPVRQLSFRYLNARFQMCWKPIRQWIHKT